MLTPCSISYAITFSNLLFIGSVIHSDPVQKKLEKTITTSKDMDKVAEATTVLIRLAMPNRLEELVHHKNDSIALLAAWQRAVRTANPDSFTKWANDLDRSIDRRALQRFLGFVEGRIKIKLPVWWDHSIAQAGVWTQQYVKSTYSKGFLEERPFYVDKKYKCMISKGARVVFSKKDDKTTFITGSDKIVVSKKTHNKQAFWELRYNAEYNMYSVTAADEYIVLGVHTPGALSCISCHNRRTKKILWIKRVRSADAKPYILNLIMLDYVSTIVYEDEVYLFGNNGAGFYIESFDLKSGERQLRFSTGF